MAQQTPSQSGASGNDRNQPDSADSTKSIVRRSIVEKIIGFVIGAIAIALVLLIFVLTQRPLPEREAVVGVLGTSAQTVVAGFLPQQFPTHTPVPNAAPQFEFVFDGIPKQEEPAFELTEELYWSETIQNVARIGVDSPQDIRGPVLVRVVPASGPPRVVAQWDDFQLSFKQVLAIPLKPSELFRYAGISSISVGLDPQQKGLPANRATQFSIEVVHNTDVLAKKLVTVENVPWIHSVQLSTSMLRGSGAITAYVRIKNFGRGAEFNIRALISDATAQTPEIMDKMLQQDWWPSKTWGNQIVICEQRIGPIPENDERTVAMQLPCNDAKLLEKHIYVLETDVVKKLDYFQFPGGDWISSPEAWRARDQPQYSTIVVVQP